MTGRASRRAGGGAADAYARFLDSFWDCWLVGRLVLHHRFFDGGIGVGSRCPVARVARARRKRRGHGAAAPRFSPRISISWAWARAKRSVLSFAERQTFARAAPRNGAREGARRGAHAGRHAPGHAGARAGREGEMRMPQRAGRARDGGERRAKPRLGVRLEGGGWGGACGYVRARQDGSGGPQASRRRRSAPGAGTACRLVQPRLRAWARPATGVRLFRVASRGRGARA